MGVDTHVGPYACYIRERGREREREGGRERERERELSLSALLELLPLLQFKTDLSFHRLWHGSRGREREKEGKRERDCL